MAILIMSVMQVVAVHLPPWMKTMDTIALIGMCILAVISAIGDVTLRMRTDALSS